jgi:hypothetical protein
MKKKLCILILIFISILFFSCKEKNNVCLNNLNKALKEKSKGNLFFYHRKNYSEAIKYYLFKKYNLVDYLQFYPTSTDSCFIEIENKWIFKKINKNKLYKTIDSLYLIDSEVSEKSVQKKEEFYRNLNDSVFFYSSDLSYPKIVFPKDQKMFLKRLKSQAIKKDETYYSSSYWLTINKNGKVEKIEKYKAHSLTIDNFLINELYKTKWESSQINKNKIKVKFRMLININ